MSAAHANSNHEGRNFSESQVGSRLDRPGDHPVAVPIVCVITRFGLRSAHFLLPTYLDYWRVVREAAHTPGLLRSALLVENPTTVYSLSIWASSEAIPQFGTNVPYHVHAARSVFGRLPKNQSGRPEIWSTKWRLDSVSNNLAWAGFNLKQEIMNFSK